MSEGDVSLIHDEDVLRRMWQQTEDFSRKKEIRAHMYRLREERLRSLYSPEPQRGKGVESAQTHVQSLLDQSFQGLKSKEVRDAGSPPKEIAYRGQDLKELSNAGWNVESENRTTDDGHTHVRSVQATIEGKYDVEGGRGQFAAVDRHRQAVTEYQDDTTSLKRNESASNTNAHEQVVRKTGDGTEFSSTTSSTSASKFQQVSSTKHEVPYGNDYDRSEKTNRENNMTKVTKTSDYERSLRSSDLESAELVSRKVEYPDENTKVIVETKRLPDGTRVTSTRKEFRTPVQSTYSEQQSKTESKYSTSSHQRSDAKSSKISRDYESRSSDIVDSQRHADDFDFKKNQMQYSNTRDDTSKTRRSSDRYETKQSDKDKTSRMTSETTDNRSDATYNITKNQQAEYSTRKDDYETKNRCMDNHRETSVTDTDRQHIATSIDKQNIKINHSTQKDDYSTTHKNKQYKTNIDETDQSNEIRDNIERHHIKKTTEQNQEDKFEKRTSSDQYETTYQSDYSQKRISQDLSPSHQAWASTLRADTPSSSRPTTRASSPGSRTYQSSTSSLRSSVSPDKTCRKPPSRGGSPSKIDRTSPSRSTSDKYSSIHSSYSSTETKTNRYTSPDRKPPVSLSRYNSSPDRKPQEPRASMSPEKHTRPSQSPDRKPGYQSPRKGSPSRHYQDLQPSSKPSHQYSSPTRISPEKSLSPIRNSASPDSQPGYMRPTAASKPPSDQTTAGKSPVRQTASQGPDRKTTSKITTIKDDHYKFIDEETKMYTRADRDNTHFTTKTTKMYDSRERDTSPLRKSPVDTTDCRPDSPSMRPALRKDSRSPSPPKGPVTFVTEQTDKNVTKLIDVTKKSDDNIYITTKYHTKPRESPDRGTPREQSPSKYGTYDKKKRTEQFEDITTLTNKDSSEKYDSITRREKAIKNTTRDSVSPVKSVDFSRELSPSKYGTYDIKRRNEETENLKTLTTTDETDVKYDSLTRREKTDQKRVTGSPPSLTKKSPRDSVSPVKSPIRDAKYKHTTDFINTERTTETINKTTSKDRPRQLVTPSTSPTRKPQTTETAPSTGQSSPTTSVSGFVYFSSPKTNRTAVTDLDNFIYSETQTSEEVDTSSKRPETLDFEKSLSPSKIPCRSPSPGKRASPIKESLPRKSSLKKPSTDFSPISPVEKPPSSFRISPTEETLSYPEHKIVKKDRPEKSYDSDVKPKPPLERRETYEERCRKILGMVSDDKVDTSITRKENYSNKTETKSDFSSPKQSPFYSPETSLKKKQIQTNDKDFIKTEQEDIIKKTTTWVTGKKSNTPSRESSPTKLHDIISQNTVFNQNKVDDQKTLTSEIVRENLDREIGYLKSKDDRSSVSPQRKVRDHPSTSPERKESTKREPEKTRSLVSPDRVPGYMKPTASTTMKHESAFVEDIEHNIIETSTQTADKETGYHKIKEIRSTPVCSPVSHKTPRSSVSPDKKTGFTETTSTTIETIRSSIDRETGFPYSASPSQPKESIPRSSPGKENIGRTYSDKIPSRNVTSPSRTPSYMKSTASSVHKMEESTSDVKDEKVSMITETKTKSTKSDSASKNVEESKHYRTPSPTKKKSKITEDNTEFMQSEREQEILGKVQRSLRKLSPNRNQRSPSRERSPDKTTISLQDLHVADTFQDAKSFRKDNIQIHEKEAAVKIEKTRTKPIDNKTPKTETKPPRTVSPTKKPSPSSYKHDKTPETSKSRSISPKKTVSPTERPQSPQVPKASGIKPREPISSHCKNTTPGTISSTKITNEVKKSSGVTKQNSFTRSSIKSTVSKVSSPTKSEPETKRAPTPKNNKENISPKKDDIRFTRTSSDNTLKTKKPTPSPQRMKSKPEIQVNDLPSTTKQTNTFTKTQKSTRESHTKMAPKPKSATALNNSSMEEDEVIIDVEQAKSSRENSPDRICPTPVSFLEDVGTPRYPDEVSEPDDEFRRRTHHTIHETESIVDDIVEICEDNELFVKRTEKDHITESDECLLSVNDKVSKFTSKIESVTKPKESTNIFKNTERKVHSDFINDNRESDECLLSVSEKVNKFAKGVLDSKDSETTSKNITEEYDTQTTFTDDYTKLSVNDKAHFFIETAENSKASKTKPAQKVERPDLRNVDESLKSDDCLLSVSDKVNKFVKTAEQFLTETTESEEKDRKIKEEYEKFMKQLTQAEDENVRITKSTKKEVKITDHKTTEDKTPSFAKETTSSQTKVKDYPSQNLKSTERAPIQKITTLRSSEAVKKAKALFENIASTQNTTDTKTTKLTDIGVLRKGHKSPAPPSDDSEVDAPRVSSPQQRPSSGTPSQQKPECYDEKPRISPTRMSTKSPEMPRTKSPAKQSAETTKTTKSVLTRYPAARDEQPKIIHPEPEKGDKPQDITTKSISEHKQIDQKVTKLATTSQDKDEKTMEETYNEVSTRRGSGKFGVELRRTSVERSTVSSERRRSSDHHQPCIEDIFDLDLLEQMLEKVTGYEQRRRIRAQIRVAKKRMETEQTDTRTKTTRHTVSKIKSPEPRPLTRSPERLPKSTPLKSTSPERPRYTSQNAVPENTQPSKPQLNGYAKEPSNLSDKRRPQSPEKAKPTLKTRSPVRQPSPDKRTRTTSPSKTPAKTKPNRFNEYASAYMKKVGLKENDVKFSDTKTKKTITDDHKTEITKNQSEFEEVREIKTATSTTKSFSERKSSKDTIEVIHVNGKRSLSPEKRRSPERQTTRAQSPTEKLYYRTPSPDFKRTKSDKTETIIRTVYETDSPKVVKKETVIKTVIEDRPRTDAKKKETIVKTTYDTEKKVQPKQVQEEKPSWVTSRNLKKTSAESRSFSKKVETERPRYRAPSPTKAVARPTDVITSSYGPGPLDADGRPLFGIKALRNGASNYQVKGTVIRQEFHSRNGGEPEGSVSVTAYSTEPKDLEQLLRSQGDRTSRIHGLAAITTTRKFGGDTGASITSATTKEERASLDQFTHNDRRVSDSTVESLSEMRSFGTIDKQSDARSIDNKVESINIDSRVESRQSVDRQRAQNKSHTQSRQIIDNKQDRSIDKTERQSVERKDAQTRKEKVERREDKKTVRQSSVKSLTEKYIKSASESNKSERPSYPKAGLILRTTAMRDSVSSDSSAHAGLGRTDSAQSLGSVEDGATVTTRTTTRTVTPAGARVATTTTTTSSSRRQEKSFLDSSTKVSGVQDILTRMKNADIVIQEGDTTEDAEARALLNKFLGATVLMAGMQGYVADQPGAAPAGKLLIKQQETVRSSGGKQTRETARIVQQFDPDNCWDEKLLRKHLEESTDYEQRRRLRARIRTLMAEQEACASAVTEALAAAGEAPDTPDTPDATDAREEEEVTVTSSVRRDSSEKTEKTVSSSTTTKTSKVVESMTRPAPKPVSPFTKFRQLEKQNSTTSPNSPKTPQTPQSPGSTAQPFFKFTDPALQASAMTIKERLLQWCRDKTRDYENVKLENFSTSWADGLAFCALVHHFLPNTFDYSKLTPEKRRRNFALAFKVAEEKAGIYPLLDVDDMVAMSKPDWKCVFTYVQSIHRRFKDQP